jgi:hypothetical protein
MMNPEKHQLDHDMSEAGINRRMRKLSKLYQFWQSVERSRKKGEVQAVHEPIPPYGNADR